MKRSIKKIAVTALLIFMVLPIVAQTEKQTDKIVAEKFERFYNKGNYDSIFAMFSLGMQKKLPLLTTTGFLESLKQDAGKINNRQFLKYTNGTYATYKTNFEGGVYTLVFSVESNLKLNSLLVKPFIEDTLPHREKNITTLQLPFKEEWTVFWGGDTKELNYHVQNEAQKNAFDLIITDAAGKSFKSDGKSNTDYYAFAKELFAPCDAEVVLAVDGIKDNIPGVMNTFHTGGNTVILKTIHNEYLVFCHFKQFSIVVKQGEKVLQGQPLGRCGNSGNSSEPHLHFHLQNTESNNNATGIKCYFDKLKVNGNNKIDYSPIKNDKIKNN